MSRNSTAYELVEPQSPSRSRNLDDEGSTSKGVSMTKYRCGF